MNALYFDDFPAHQEFMTKGRTVPEADIFNFAALSKRYADGP